MSNLLKTFLCGAAVLAANPAFAQISFQGGGSSITSTGPATGAASITTTVPGSDYTGTLNVAVSAGTPHSGSTMTSATTGMDASGGNGSPIGIVGTNKALSLQKGPAAASVGVSTLIATQGNAPIAVDVVVGVARTTPFGSSAFTYAIGGGASGASTTTITHK
jgi:hypothetical protein